MPTSARRSQISRAFGPALGVSTADFNNDGWMDIYVANDGQENQLWVNRRDGTFQNTALLAGVALPLTGKAEASMGVDAGDVDDDGDDDLVMTELTGEGSNLFVNDGSGTFEDHSARTGVGPASAGFTGFGAAWFDYDNDGRLDLMAVNGAVQVIEALRQAGDPFPVHQRKALFHNAGGGRFDEVSARAGAAFALSEVGRGAAFGDVDNDGDIDVLVGNNNGPVRLLLNQAAAGRHWVGLRLVGGPGGRDLIGARVTVKTAAGVRHRRARSDGSYASANDPRVHVGLGDSSGAGRRRGAVARRAHRDVPGRGGRSLHHAHAGDRPVSGRRACLVALAAACACAAACRPAEHHPPSSPASAPAAVQPVALPDISRAADAVQAQIREQHAKMTSAVAPPAAPAAARAAAYGEMGKLFIATEFYAAAERCFLNARALAPGDMRWSYYLAHVARLANDPAKAAGLFEQTLGRCSRTTCRRSSGSPRCTWRRASRAARSRSC